MKKSELKKLIKEVVQEQGFGDYAVLGHPSVKPILRKLYDETLNGRLCDEDDLNELAIVAFRAGKYGK